MLSVIVTCLAALALSSIAFFVWCWVDLLTIANCLQRRSPNHDRHMMPLANKKPCAGFAHYELNADISEPSAKQS
jgi:hypothetical protein